MEGDRLEFLMNEDGELKVDPLKKRSIFDALGILNSPLKYNPELHREQIQIENSKERP